MIEWTDSAEKELRNYLEGLRTRPETPGVDSNEVAEDIRRHVEAEIAEAGLSMVTAEDIRRIFSRMGMPDMPGPSGRENEGSGIQKGAQGNPEAMVLDRGMGYAASSLIVIFGVILPLAAIVVELSSRMCSDIFFDPLPTIGHVILYALIAVANLAVVIAAFSRRQYPPLLLGLLNGVAIGVSVFYTILFLPITPISAMAIIVFGLGFLGLSPALAAICSIACRFYLRRMVLARGAKKARGLLWGILIAFVALLGMEAPSAVTRIGLNMAASSNKDTSDNGIRMLRSIGSDEVMLQACYERPGQATDIISFALAISDPISPQQARTIYYRVTGQAFNSVEPPSITGRGRYNAWDDFNPNFEELGGTTVGGQTRNLELTSSRLDGSIDADAALAYVEWTMIFRNNSSRQREARAQIALPPGAVVSRLTLWVDGQEREAAFAARRKVREAYQAVVRQRRDPVLVTTCGPDRVLMQCFPVPPNGGQMKIRLGITAPLNVSEPGSGVLRIPHFMERNFQIPDNTKHMAWFEASSPFAVEGNQWQQENPRKELHAVRGSLSNGDISGGTGVISVERDAEVTRAWTTDPHGDGQSVICQTIGKQDVIKPERVILVVDGSAAMHRIGPVIIEQLKMWVRGAPFEFGLLVASDEVIEICAPTVPSSSELDEVINRLSDVEWAGGQDSVPALERAWDMAAAKPNGVVIWLHGSQAVELASPEGLLQRWQRRPDGPSLFDVQALPGPNRIVEKLDGAVGFLSGDGQADAGESVQRLMDILAGRSKQTVLMRQRVAVSDFDSEQWGKQTSAHLARLWAKEQVELNAANGSDGIEQAIQIAAKYQLVTSVSGAVVLENQQQFNDAGLEPADPASVPTIPEPETWMLICVVAILFAWVLRQHRLKRATVNA